MLGGDEGHQGRDSAEQSCLLLDWIAIVAEMLQVSGRIGLHHRIRIVQESDHFVQIRITPPDTLIHQPMHTLLTTVMAQNHDLNTVNQCDSAAVGDNVRSNHHSQ